MQDLLVRALQIVGARPDPKVNSSPSWGIRILKLPKTRAEDPQLAATSPIDTRRGRPSASKPSYNVLDDLMSTIAVQ